MKKQKTTGVCGVYSFRNLHNNKRYVGSTVDLAFRKYIHLKQLRNGVHHSKHFQHAWNKYGEAAFLFEVLETCEAIKHTLLAHEQYWMDLYQSYHREFGYNHLPRAGSRLGSPWTPEHRAKMVGRKLSDEHRRKMGEVRKGHPFYGTMTAERRAKMVANLPRGEAHHRFGKPAPDNVKKAFDRTGIPSWNKGKEHTDEHRANLKTSHENCSCPHHVAARGRSLDETEQRRRQKVQRDSEARRQRRKVAVR